MRRRLASLAAAVALSLLATAPAASVSAVRPVATYSIVARDPATGELGVAVQSHWFSVGSVAGKLDGARPLFAQACRSGSR